jgi:hypothetical protein
MDEIFLQDYANNVAQAQDPFGIAAVQAQPGFENYQPSFVNQDLTPMGLVNETPSRLPDFKQIAKNVIEDQAKRYMIKQIGLEGIKGNILKSVMGTNPYVAGIATLGSALTGNSLNMSNILARKRAEKNYEMNQRRMQNELNKSQIQAIQQRLDAQPVSNQDRERGQAPSSPTPSAPASRQSRQTSGVGGLHSGY